METWPLLIWLYNNIIKIQCVFVTSAYYYYFISETNLTDGGLIRTCLLILEGIYPPSVI